MSLGIIDSNSLSPGFAVFDGTVDDKPRYMVVELYQDNGWHLRLVASNAAANYYDPVTDTLKQTSNQTGLTGDIINAAGLQGIAAAGAIVTINDFKKSDITLRLVPPQP